MRSCFFIGSKGKDLLIEGVYWSISTNLQFLWKKYRNLSILSDKIRETTTREAKK